MKVHLRMVGCRLNQSEIDTMARQFAALGHDVVATPEEAEHFVLNTCAVTNEAAKTEPQAHPRFSPRQAQWRNDRHWAATRKSRRRRFSSYRAWGASSTIEANPALVAQVTGETVDEIDLEPIERRFGAGATGKTRAFVKVQDGCDNACTFCVTTVARGAGRSRPIAEILARNELSAAMRLSGSGLDRRASGQLWA